MKYGYDEDGNRIYENVDGYYYDEDGICYFKYKPSVNYTKWNKKKNVWEYEAPTLDLKELRKRMLNYIYEVLEIGFTITIDGKNHIQRCREREMVLLNSQILNLKSKGSNVKEMWRHDDDDVQEYSLEQLKYILQQGSEFAKYIYGVFDIILKEKLPCNSLEDFIKYVNKYSSIKVREVE